MSLEKITNKTLKSGLAAIINTPVFVNQLHQIRSELKQQYTGERLREEHDKIDASVREATMAANDAFSSMESSLKKPIITLRNKAIEDGKDASLNPEKISPDFKLLDLPTELTRAERQVLYDRNWADPLFVRALVEYEEKHNMKTDRKVDMSSNPYDRALNAIDRVMNRVSNFQNGIGGNERVMYDNPQLLQEWDNTINSAYESLLPVMGEPVKSVGEKGDHEIAYEEITGQILEAKMQKELAKIDQEANAPSPGQEEIRGMIAQFNHAAKTHNQAEMSRLTREAAEAGVVIPKSE